MASQAIRFRGIAPYGPHRDDDAHAAARATYLEALTADRRAGAVVGGDGALLAGDAALGARAGAVLRDAAPGAALRLPDGPGAVHAARSATHGVALAVGSPARPAPSWRPTCTSCSKAWRRPDPAAGALVASAALSSWQGEDASDEV